MAICQATVPTLGATAGRLAGHCAMTVLRSVTLLPNVAHGAEHGKKSLRRQSTTRH